MSFKGANFQIILCKLRYKHNTYSAIEERMSDKLVLGDKVKQRKSFLKCVCFDWLSGFPQQTKALTLLWIPHSLPPSHLVIVLSLGPGGFLFLFTSLSVALSFSGLTVCLSIFFHQCVPNHTLFPPRDSPTGAEREGSDYLMKHWEKNRDLFGSSPLEKWAFNKTWLPIHSRKAKKMLKSVLPKL